MDFVNCFFLELFYSKEKDKRKKRKPELLLIIISNGKNVEYGSKVKTIYKFIRRKLTRAKEKEMIEVPLCHKERIQPHNTYADRKLILVLTHCNNGHYKRDE
jgi:hypothetical protein